MSQNNKHVLNVNHQEARQVAIRLVKSVPLFCTDRAHLGGPDVPYHAHLGDLNSKTRAHSRGSNFMRRAWFWALFWQAPPPYIHFHPVTPLSRTYARILKLKWQSELTRVITTHETNTQSWAEALNASWYLKMALWRIRTSGRTSYYPLLLRELCDNNDIWKLPRRGWD